MRNYGCDACSGYVPRPVVLKPIVWQAVVLASDSVWDGVVGDMLFIARSVAGHGWNVNFNAC